jgi:hypothetical protein
MFAFFFNPFCDGDTFVADDRSESENGPRGHHQDCGGSHPHSLRNFYTAKFFGSWLGHREKKRKILFCFSTSALFFGPIIKYKKGPLGTGTSCIHENI